MRKSEKRARGAARYAKALEESRQSGLAALRGDHERRRQKQEEAIKEARRKQSTSEGMKKMTKAFVEGSEAYNKLGESAKTMGESFNQLNVTIDKTNENLAELNKIKGN